MLNKKQCRVILASGLMVSASMMFAGVARASQDNGVVSGTVAAINDVVYADPPANAALTPAGTTGMDFGTVNVHSNSSTGWTLTVDSANDGVLKKGSETIAYSAFTAAEASGAPAGASSIDMTSATAPVASTTSLNSVCAPTGGCNYALTADVASTDGKSAGLYTDTLTFTLTAQ